MGIEMEIEMGGDMGMDEGAEEGAEREEEGSRRLLMLRRWRIVRVGVSVRVAREMRARGIEQS
jgi:hypothetical protein